MGKEKDKKEKKHKRKRGDADERSREEAEKLVRCVLPELCRQCKQLHARASHA